jgi:hypothetical protein
MASHHMGQSVNDVYDGMPLYCPTSDSERGSISRRDERRAVPQNGLLAESGAKSGSMGAHASPDCEDGTTTSDASSDFDDGFEEEVSTGASAAPPRPAFEVGQSDQQGGE